jgi:hypothetical protein
MNASRHPCVQELLAVVTEDDHPEVFRNTLIEYMPCSLRQYCDKAVAFTMSQQVDIFCEVTKVRESIPRPKPPVRC